MTSRMHEVSGDGDAARDAGVAGSSRCVIITVGRCRTCG